MLHVIQVLLYFDENMNRDNNLLQEDSKPLKDSMLCYVYYYRCNNAFKVEQVVVFNKKLFLRSLFQATAAHPHRTHEECARRVCLRWVIPEKQFNTVQYNQWELLRLQEETKCLQHNAKKKQNGWFVTKQIKQSPWKLLERQTLSSCLYCTLNTNVFEAIYTLIH